MRRATCVGLFTLVMSTAIADAQDTSTVSPALRVAQADTSSPQVAADHSLLEEVTVSGTRIVRDGFESPTPVTVFGAEQLQQEAPINIADALNKLPIVAGGVSQGNIGVNTSNGEAGSNTMNLRSMGAGRTLVLFDGRRVVSVGLRGTTDIGQIPTTLLQRVDIVTGGASAPYGSDAVTGIVNFVLDRNFTGIKGNVMGGVTDYGDNEQYKGEFAYGTTFGGERGHFLIGAEYTDSDGIRSTGGQRPWAKNTKSIVNAAYTPTNGQPYFLVRPNAEFSSMAPGLLITAGPLRGTEFFGAGQTRPFEYGANVTTTGLTMEGGANTDTERTQLVQPQERTNVFTRLSYDLNDYLSVWTDFAYSETSGINDCCTHFFPANITIRNDNAYLPAQVATQMATLGLTSFVAGTSNEDLPSLQGYNSRDMRQYAVGFRGKFALLGTDWGWDAYVQRGISRVNLNVHQLNRTKWNLALDAVRDANGTIVCRSTLTNPTNGCVPLNRFGSNTITQQAQGYVLGVSQYQEKVTEDVAEVSFHGEPFSTWADTVSVAFGAQYREEKVTSFADPLSISNQWFAANFKPTFGSYDVLDGFMETVIPLLRDKPWAKSLDLNAALRITDYSTSGNVNTWKVGMTYEPNSQVRLRATQSRDIRSPGLGDLFRAGQVNSSTANDPFNGNAAVTFNRPLVGNPLMQPEKGDTTGFGVVYQPEWLQGFTASVDYFKIKVTDAFAIPDVQLVLDRCFAGDQTYCAAIQRDVNGALTFVTVRPLNADQQESEGYDIELGYSLSMSELVSSWNGSLALRGLATHTISNELIVNGVNIQVAGKNSDDDAYFGIPNWRWQVGATYNNDILMANLTVRGISSGVFNNAWIQCTSGCPTSTTIHRTVDNNQVAGAIYLDSSVGYKFMAGAEAYLRVDNLLNKGAPAVADDYFLGQGFNPSLYDSIGRTYRAGVRFSF
jgi:iron complex outermembrane receptor protein